jgi:hypothetical protein
MQDCRKIAFAAGTHFLYHEAYFPGLDTNPFKELGWLGCQDLTLV